MVIIVVIRGVKEYGLSNMTPKILGFFTVGILTPSTEMCRSSLYSFVQFVNKVAVDLIGKSVRIFAVKK